ncbi:A/G-specific adenine glycosylase [Castellaniella sp.]|uniref:A/G-specific adenine glycosylase n=1 Tax=Castellaniella sp. TaxID=1955812 RepID=UPI00355EE96F
MARSRAPAVTRPELAGLAERVSTWQLQHGRHDLPWQGTRDPYRIWLSEIMLQQTQAATVIPWYQRFLRRFPDLATLASASLDEVLTLWAGLGYYARARHLHQCAQIVYTRYAGRFPQTAAELARLPGIGPSTAAAIAALSHGERTPILDGNVRRVFMRLEALDADPAAASTLRALWALAQRIIEAAPASLDMTAYTQGLMDLGATVCTRHRPDCARCPLAGDCLAHRQGLQNALPRPRKRRDRPLRQSTVLILQHEDHVLLTRRPARGIWGGLWSLPEFADAPALQDYCLHHAQAGQPARALATFEHDFTHFRLQIHPWYQPVEGRRPGPAAEQAWVSLPALARHGLPAPIARLLAGLQAGAGACALPSAGPARQ